MPRTNNAVEGWHNAMQSSISCSHPTIFKFIQAIKNEQALQEMKLTQICSGQELKEKKKYRDFDNRLRNVVRSYEYNNNNNTSNFVEYLGSIAHNIST